MGAKQRIRTFGRTVGQIVKNNFTAEPQAWPQDTAPDDIPQVDGTDTSHPANALRTNSLLTSDELPLVKSRSHTTDHNAFGTPSDGNAHTPSTCDGTCNCQGCPVRAARPTGDVANGLSQAGPGNRQSAVNGHATANAQPVVSEGASFRRSVSNTAIRNGVSNENAGSTADNENQNGNGQAATSKAEGPNNTQVKSRTGLRARLQNRWSNSPLAERISRRSKTRSEDAPAPNGTPADFTPANPNSANSIHDNSVPPSPAPVNSASANSDQANSVVSATSASGNADLPQPNGQASRRSSGSKSDFGLGPNDSASASFGRPQTSCSSALFITQAPQALTNTSSQTLELLPINTGAITTSPNDSHDTISRFLPPLPSHAYGYGSSAQLTNAPIGLDTHAYGSSSQSTEPYASPVAHAYGHPPEPLPGPPYSLIVSGSSADARAMNTKPRLEPPANTTASAILAEASGMTTTASLEPNTNTTTPAMLTEPRNSASNAARRLSEPSGPVTAADIADSGEIFSPLSLEPELSTYITAPIDTARPQFGPSESSNPGASSASTTDPDEMISRARSDSVLTSLAQLFRSSSGPSTSPVNTAYDSEVPTLPRPNPRPEHNHHFDTRTNMRVASAGRPGPLNAGQSEDDLDLPGSGSKGKGRGRQGKGKRS